MSPLEKLREFQKKTPPVRARFSQWEKTMLDHSHIATIEPTINGLAPNRRSVEVTSELVWCSPALARQLRDTCHFERQRQLDPRNVQRLRIEMDRGRFIEGTQIYICILPDGAMKIVNGNHTLEAVAAGTAPVLLSFCYRPARSDEEVGAIYARFDIQKVRDMRAGLRAMGLENVLDNANWTAPFGAALIHLLQSFGDVGNARGNVEVQSSRDVRAKLFRETAEYADLYIAAAHSGENAETVKYMRRSGVMAVGLELFRYQPSAAMEFFTGVAKDEGTSGDPARALVKYLRGHSTANKSVRAEQSRATAGCWNAFFGGSQISYTKPNSMVEFRLAGTPWRKGFDPLAAYAPYVSQEPAQSGLRKSREH